MAKPSMTFNTAGNVRPNSSLAAGAGDYHSTNYSQKIEGQLTVKVTPGASISATRGVVVRFRPIYAADFQWSTLESFQYVMPAATASTAEVKTFFLGTGRWLISLNNLDATYAVSVEITDATVDEIS